MDVSCIHLLIIIKFVNFRQLWNFIIGPHTETRHIAGQEVFVLYSYNGKNVGKRVHFFQTERYNCIKQACKKLDSIFLGIFKHIVLV